MTRLISINDEPARDIREHLWPHTMLSVVCKIIGHRPAWIEAIVPNPYAVDSRVWGCSRCTKTFPKE